MWKDYFGPEARIYGVDVNPGCKNLEEDRVSIFIGNQADRLFLKTLAAEIPRIDILLDDGGHTMVLQINTFEELFPKVSENGVYLTCIPPIGRNLAAGISEKAPSSNMRKISSMILMPGIQKKITSR